MPDKPPDARDDATLSEGSLLSSVQSIGPYRLVQRQGVGGMGEVWRAEQTEPLRRTVALKLIKAGMDTKAVVARFDSERQALALMDHPNIAKVFDAGATPEGRPYFVMEYVPGLPITEYCDKHRLTLKERLALFMQVCDGVQHAHQKAIIHRDLKPSNVLVEELDHKPVPKIIDFGLAKATGSRLTDMTMFTEVGVMLGTPAYMSPEQADSQERNIDTRTDVYSLGVILYQLLVGSLPFSSHDQRDQGTEVMLRKIREQEPTRPSTKIKSLGDSSSEFALQRREEPQALARHLRGELDWITLKALEKDRARRYGSPSELSMDIQRYLQDQPVLAGPPSATYRTGKFIRRHRFGVAVAAATVLLLIGFATTMAVQARRIAKERDRANREAEASKRVADFMTRMFKVSDPGEARGNSVTAREILDQASNEIDSGLASDPEVQARMLNVMGNVYYNLGLFARAESLLSRAVEIRRRVLGSQNLDTLDSIDELGSAIWQQARYPEAEKLVREALDGRQRILGPNHPDTLTSMNNLGLLLRLEGKTADAEKLFRYVLDQRRRTLGPDDNETLHSDNNLALIVWDEGHLSEAESLLRQASEGWRRLYGMEHPSTLMATANLAGLLNEEGHQAESEKLNREVLAVKIRVLGPEHPHTLLTRDNLAQTLTKEGRYAEAEKLERETIEIDRHVLGPQHPSTVNSMLTMADILTGMGKYPELEKLRYEVLDVRRRTLGPDHPDTLSALELVGNTLAYEKQYAKAETIFREAVQRARQNSDKSVRATAWYNYACGAAIAGHRDAAFDYLGKATAAGSKDVAVMANDTDLKALRSDPRFDALIAQAKQQNAKP
jgi:serine/threonine protein kinase